MVALIGNADATLTVDADIDTAEVDLSGTNDVFIFDCDDVASGGDVTDLATIATNIGALIGVTASDEAIFFVCENTAGTDADWGMYHFLDDGAGNTTVVAGELTLMSDITTTVAVQLPAGDISQ